MKMPCGQYVHVPFCAKKCDYCDFFSEKCKKEQVLRYFEGLEEELSALPPDFVPRTVYIGGGTPSCLTEDDLACFFRILERFFDVDAVLEYTCEVNPGTFTAEKGEILRESGVNRVSLGVQSLNGDVLSFLGRIHSKNDVFEAVSRLKGAGINNFSVDLMYGLPRKAGQDVGADLADMLSLAPSHISCYCLSLEPGTRLAARAAAGEFAECDDETCLLEYEQIRVCLAGEGFEQYEISNFCRPGMACEHNLFYWRGNDYIGVGPAAHSFWQGVRYSNPADMDQWLHFVAKSGALNQAEPRLSVESMLRERLVFGLRMLGGVNTEALFVEFGCRPQELIDTLERLVADGFLVWCGGCIRLADRALFVSNTLFSELI